METDDLLTMNDEEFDLFCQEWEEWSREMLQDDEWWGEFDKQFQEDL